MNFSFQWVCFSTRFPLLTFSMIRYCLHTFFQFFKHDFSSFNILIIPTLKILPNGSNIWAHAKAVSHPCFFLPTNGLHFPVLFPCLHNFWWKLNMLIFYINSGYWSSKHRLGLLVYFSLWYKVDSSSNAWWQPVTSLPQRLSLGHTHSHPRMRVVLARLSVFHFFVKQSALGGITPSSKSPVIAPWGINYLGGGPLISSLLPAAIFTKRLEVSSCPRRELFLVLLSLLACHQHLHCFWHYPGV